MKAKQVISEYLRDAFSDEALEQLMFDAANGEVPYLSWARCLVGHADMAVAKQAWRRADASLAYYQLGTPGFWQGWLQRPSRLNQDALRMRRLVKLCQREFRRRDAARAEVIGKAREVIKPTLTQPSTLPSESEPVSTRESVSPVSGPKQERP